MLCWSQLNEVSTRAPYLFLQRSWKQRSLEPHGREYSKIVCRCVADKLLQHATPLEKLLFPPQDCLAPTEGSRIVTVTYIAVDIERTASGYQRYFAAPDDIIVVIR